MDSTRFDRIAKVFADRKLSRRQALAQGGMGIAAAGLAAAGFTAAAAQDATPAASVDGTPAAQTGSTVEMLFLQSFQSGTVVPIEGQAGRYTLTLEQGLGQTIYFSDRPDRIVGATPTDQFLPALGFVDDNPPNAALVAEIAPGETDIAVVELFNPTYDTTTHTATYEIEVLDNWQDTLEMGFAEAPTDLGALAPTFGAAQLFIDDCGDADMLCFPPGGGQTVGRITNAEHGGYCYNWGQAACVPCRPNGTYDAGVAAAKQLCNEKYPACNGNCRISNPCFGIGCPGEA